MILSGYPELEGSTILERRRSALEHHDALRTALMWEPRGHADMYGCLIVPPETEGSDFGVLFLHNEGYSTMCGHGIIAVTTVVLETGMLPVPPDPKPRSASTHRPGLVVARGHVEDGRVTRVAFTNVPSFVLSGGPGGAGAGARHGALRCRLRRRLLRLRRGGRGRPQPSAPSPSSS